MGIVTLERVPNQSFSLTIAGRRFDVRLLDLGDRMAADITINGQPVVSAMRLVGGTPILPYRYLEAGNLIFVTDGADPDWRQFGLTQSLVTLDDAGDPVSSAIPGGGGSGPGPGPGPGAYLEKAQNLADLTNVAAALLNLGVYSQTQVDDLLAALQAVVDTKASQDALDALEAVVEALPAPPTAATVAQFRAGSGSGYVSPAVGSGAMEFVALTRAAVASGGLDFDNFVNASILLDANLTVGGWIVGYPCKTGILRFKQDTTGGRTVAWPSGYIVPAGFSLQATAGGVTDVPYLCEADNKIRLYNPSKWVA